MKDHISLTTTPVMEDCVAPSDKNYWNSATLEAHAYKHQLIRTHGMNPPGTQFRIVECEHRQAAYVDLEFHYDDEDQRHVAYVAQVNAGCLHWDKEALQKLRRSGYSLRLQASFRCSWQRRDADIENNEAFYTDNNGPTGHGDICYSDAHPRL